MRGMLTRREFAAAAAVPLLASAAQGGMRVGCQTRAYGSPLPDKAKFLAVLDDLRETGYAGFETNYRTLEHSFDTPAAMRREIEHRGVEMIGLHVGAGLFEAEKIPADRKLVERVARATAELGGKHVIVSGRRLPETPDGRVERAAALEKAKQLDSLARFCRELGVTLSSHNHTYEVRNDAEEIRLVLGNSENVSLLFDVGHVHNDEVNVPEFVAEHSDRIAGLHLRDVKGGDEVMIGTGKVDFAAIGRSLRSKSWQGWLIVEVNKRDDVTSREMVTRVRKYLRTTMKV